MNKITALESYKISIVLEDFWKKLAFLDLLKQNMGEEMTEQMSEEITKAMEEQRALEQRYASLVTKRGQLKGLSDKAELAETKEQLLQVSKDLKNQTRILCRQLKDNPDVQGNQQLVKRIKQDISEMATDLVDEMTENQNFSSFKQKVDEDLAKVDEFGKLHDLEKDLNREIKEINDNLKRKQDDFAKEAQESSDDIARLKKQVNECKTQSELEIQYKRSEISGKLAMFHRLNNMKETALRTQIKDVRSQLEIEKLVSEKICDFIKKKKDVIDVDADQRDRLKDQNVNKLITKKEEIKDQKEEADNEITKMHELCNEEEENRRNRDAQDDENAQVELQKQQEKIDMDKAAKYVQRKWNWFQTEGKFLAKKRKGKKGKGKKKKK